MALVAMQLKDFDWEKTFAIAASTAYNILPEVKRLASEAFRRMKIDWTGEGWPVTRAIWRALSAQAAPALGALRLEPAACRGGSRLSHRGQGTGCSARSWSSI